MTKQTYQSQAARLIQRNSVLKYQQCLNWVRANEECIHEYAREHKLRFRLAALAYWQTDKE